MSIGRDLLSSKVGGTWLALNICGKFATLLNVSELDKRPNSQSRGQLVENFVKGDTPALQYMQGLPDIYNGFKLITISMKLAKLILKFILYNIKPVYKVSHF